MPDRAVMTAGHEPAGLSALNDLATAWCLRVAATLRIAEHLAAGISGIDDLAVAAGTDPESLGRILGHLASEGVFTQPAPGEFGLNGAAIAQLDPEQQLELAYQEALGLPFSTDLQACADIAADFDDLTEPAAHGAPDPEISLTGGWESVRTVVDVGGGTGAMLAEILRVQPAVHGTLLDLPRTVARAGEVFRAAGVTDRVNIIGESFFDPLPAGADLYLLKSVLADWPDREATAILSRCAEAAGSAEPGRSAGRVVVLSGVSPDPIADDPLMAAPAGKHRTVAEFSVLAELAGLDVSVAQWQPSGRFVVECCPRARSEQSSASIPA